MCQQALSSVKRGSGRKKTSECWAETEIFTFILITLYRHQPGDTETLLTVTFIYFILNMLKYQKQRKV